MSLKFIYLFINKCHYNYLLLDAITIYLFIFSPLEVELLKTFCSTETLLPKNKQKQTEIIGKGGQLKKKRTKLFYLTYLGNPHQC